MLTKILTIAFALFISLAPFAAKGKPAAPTRLHVVILDDVGCVNVGACRVAKGISTAQTLGATPRLDALAASGVNFTNMKSYATCSPTRVALLTGLRSSNPDNRIGSVFKSIPSAVPDSSGVEWGQEVQLNLGDPDFLFRQATTAGYPAVFNGKLHISNDMRRKGMGTNTIRALGIQSASSVMLGGGPQQPEDLFNTVSIPMGREAFLGHNCWVSYDRDSIDDSTPSVLVSSYTNDSIFDATKALITGAGSTGNWFTYTSSSAPHSGFASVTTASCPGLSVDDRPPGDTVSSTEFAVYQTATTYADTKVGELIDLLDLDPITGSDILVVVGDNGCPGEVCPSEIPTNRAKGQPYPGGYDVPLIIAGVGIEANNTITANFQIEDLNATLVDLMGGTRRGPRARSFANCLDDAASANGCVGKDAVILSMFKRLGSANLAWQLPPHDGDLLGYTPSGLAVPVAWAGDYVSCIAGDYWLNRVYATDTIRGNFAEEFFNRATASSPFFVIGDAIATNALYTDNKVSGGFAASNELVSGDFSPAASATDIANLEFCQREIDRVQIRRGRPAPQLGGGARW